MNLNEGYGLPLDVAIYMNYIEAQGAKNIRRCPALTSCQISGWSSTSRHFHILGSLSPSIFPFHLTAFS
jgi:hypothetical protein